MKKGILKPLAFVLISALFIIACKEKLGPNPTLKFVTDAKYTYADDSVSIGDSVLIGLKCNWNGNDLLTGLNVYRNDLKEEKKSIVFKTGMEALGISFYIEKKATYEEILDFELLDASGNAAALSLSLTNDSTKLIFTDIVNVTLGAQNNSTPNGFYSLSKKTAYEPTDTLVTKNHVTIDFIFAYDENDKAIIGSPKSDWTDIFDLSGWTTTDVTTLFAKAEMTDEEYFELTKAKILLIYKMLTTENKVDSVAANDYYVFKTSASKYGMIKVKSVTEGADGAISFDLKIEK